MQWQTPSRFNGIPNHWRDHPVFHPKQVLGRFEFHQEEDEKVSKYTNHTIKINLFLLQTYSIVLVLVNNKIYYFFLYFMCFRYGPLFCTNLAGRPVVVSSDPDFNYYIFQQEGKLVELWYMDSFARLVGLDPSQSITSTGYIHKYVKNLALAHIGTEALKDGLLSKAEDMIRTRLHDWSKLPAFEFKACVSSVIYQTLIQPLV